MSTMDDLIEFLKARLDEDEAAAKAAIEPNDLGGGGADWQVDLGEDGVDGIGGPLIYHDGIPTPAQAAHVARHDPARVLREVAADRAILARYESVTRDLPDWEAARELLTKAGAAVLLGVIKLRAAVYSDHPDYRQVWAP